MKCPKCGQETIVVLCSCGYRFEEETAAPPSPPPKRFCANCGAEVTGNFCAKCGTKIMAEQYCSKCGCQVEGNFCPNCGQPINADQTDAANGQQSKLSMSTNQNVYSKNYTKSGYITNNRIQPRKSNPLKIVGIVFGILLFTGFMASLSDSDSDSTSKSYSSSTSSISTKTSSRSSSSKQSSSKVESVSSSSKMEEKITLESVLMEIGFTEEEALKEAKKFTKVGITSITISDKVSSVGVDELKAYPATAQDGEEFFFTVEKRRVFNIEYYDTVLYNEDQGYLSTISDVYVPETKVDSTTYATLQVNTEDVIKRVLKSPSTAKFPWLDGWSISREDNKYTVSGYVDAQNGFGAEVRSYFTVYWEVNMETGKGSVTKLIFDGQEIGVK